MKGLNDYGTHRINKPNSDHFQDDKIGHSSEVGLISEVIFVLCYVIVR